MLMPKVVVCFACGAAGTAAFVDVFASVEFCDDIGAEEACRKLSFERFCWCEGGL